MNLTSLWHRVMMAFARSVVRAVNDANGRQILQIEVTRGELLGGVERAQNYGFTSNPQPGADGFVAFIGGERTNGVVLCVDDRRFRITGMQPGEVAIYDDIGNKIELKRDKIHITAVDEVRVDAPEVHINCSGNASIQADTLSITAETTFNGPVVINGNIEVDGTGTINGKRFDETHTHSNGNDGNPTGGII